MYSPNARSIKQALHFVVQIYSSNLYYPLTDIRITKFVDLQKGYLGRTVSSQNRIGMTLLERSGSGSGGGGCRGAEMLVVSGNLSLVGKRS